MRPTGLLDRPGVPHRQLVHLRLNQRRFLDPTGATNRAPRRIHARWPGHMVHLDVKKVGVIPDSGGWRVVATLHRRLDAESEASLARGLPYPTRWDRLHDLADVYAFPARHFHFHAHQLTLGPSGDECPAGGDTEDTDRDGDG